MRYLFAIALLSHESFTEYIDSAAVTFSTGSGMSERVVFVISAGSALRIVPLSAYTRNLYSVFAESPVTLYVSAVHFALTVVHLPFFRTSMRYLLAFAALFHVSFTEYIDSAAVRFSATAGLEDRVVMYALVGRLVFVPFIAYTLNSYSVS